MEIIPQRDLLSTAELRSAFETLSQTDLVRLEKKATALAPGTGMEPKDLLHEAIVRSLEENGGRNCPRDVKPVTFLDNVMRSIASHAREHWARETPSSAIKEDQDDPIVKVPDPAPSPEQAVIGQIDRKRTLACIEAIFNDDPQAEAVMIGIMEGWAPHEVRELESMSSREYDAARKRARRALLREFPKGPSHE